MAPSRGKTGNRLLTTFRGRRLPVEASLAGYSALIERFELQIPLHHEMAAISPKNIRRKEDGWIIYPAALLPRNTVVDHLVFALKHEGLQLLALKKVFEVLDRSELVSAAQEKPTSGYMRRLCHLFEWLTESRLDISDVTAGAYVDLVDLNKQFGTEKSFNSKRFRVRDNLPGTVEFCPVVFKTHRIESFIAQNLSQKAQAIVESAPKALIARAAAFLLLNDSKASFAIEGEDPPKDRLARWGYVVSKAGQMDLTKASLVDLQRDLIGDDRFVKTGLRREGGFVGRHDAMNRPVPDHVSARACDLSSLLDGLIDFAERSNTMRFHPVLAAACIAFGFVYIHPFEDGNGRIHRFLMHHVLAEMQYTPEQIIFPISSVILDDVSRYKDVLETVSKPMLEWIEWRATDNGNVEVLNDTADFYRFIDATAHVEFLFKCIQRSVEKDLPDELGFLERRDTFHSAITDIVDMGERTIDLLLRFLQQNKGSLSKRARSHEFSRLTDNEVQQIEETYGDLFQI